MNALASVHHDDFGLVELRDSDLLASGGEGSVYSFAPRPDMVAKVCHPSMIDRARRAKIDHVIAYPPINWDASGHVFVAWQASLLRVRASANVNARDEYGDTPLHHAAREDKSETATMLLGAGADADARGRDELTPLHSAARRNSSEVADSLMRAGADVNAEDQNGWTPLRVAAHYGSSGVAKVLRGEDVDTGGWGSLPT